MDLIGTLEQEEIKRLKKDVPDFSPGEKSGMVLASRLISSCSRVPMRSMI